MKFFAASILLIALLAQNCSRYMVLLNFEINSDYIAKNLCENKAKPKSCCKGKCFLKKELAKADKEEGTTKNTTSKDKSGVLFFKDIKSIQIRTLGIFQKQIYTVRSRNFFSTNCCIDIFHPPQI